jgi:hypothetical protein
MKVYILNFRTIYQFGFSMLIIAALTTQFIYGGFVDGFNLPYIALFISYFTILSNILVAVVLSAEASASLERKRLSVRFDWLRGFAVFCIIATGVTYSFFSHAPGAATLQMDNSLSWANQVFHHVMPIVMALDWILFPPKHVVKWMYIVYWLLFTALYAVYVELLGLATGEYPYFFLDPTKIHGYTGVARAALAFIPFFLVFGVVIVIANKLRTARFKKR